MVGNRGIGLGSFMSAFRPQLPELCIISLNHNFLFCKMGICCFLAELLCISNEVL